MAPKTVKQKSLRHAREIKAEKKAMKDLEIKESSDSEKVEEIQCIKNDELKKTNVTHVVLGDLLAGTSYSTSQIILAANGNKPVSRAAYFKKQSEIIPKVEMVSNQ